MIGPWQHRVHMRSSFTSMSAAGRSLIRADTGRGVTQDLALASTGDSTGDIWKVAKVFPKVARFVARRFKKKKNR